MHQILFEILGFPIRAYGTVIALAILLSLGVGIYFARGTKYQRHVTDMIVYVIIGALIGARFWHVFFFQWDYYQDHLGQLLSVWNGGLAIQGGLVGGFIAGAFYTWRHKLNFWEFADILAPAIILGQGIGRIACLLNGGAFGAPTGSDFGVVYPEGTIAYATYGSQPLWPATIWEGQWDLLVMGLLIILKNKRWPTGFIFLAYNILYSIGRFFLGFLRGDSEAYLFGLKGGQLTSVVIIIVALILMAVFFKKSNHRVKEATS